MATIYKRRELRPIPGGATIGTYRGKPYATWTDAEGTYGDLFPGQDAEAVASLPDIMGGGSDAQRASGTDGQSGEVVRGQHGSKSAQNATGSCEPDKNSPDDAGLPNVLAFNALGEKKREPAKRGESRPRGNRTGPFSPGFLV